MTLGFRLNAQPLLELAAATAGKPLHREPYCHYCGNCYWTTDGCVKHGELATRLGVDRRTIERWKRNGITVTHADEAATYLGYNPIAIWGLNWDDPEYVDN